MGQGGDDDGDSDDDDDDEGKGKEGNGGKDEGQEEQEGKHDGLSSWDLSEFGDSQDGVSISFSDEVRKMLVGNYAEPHRSSFSGVAWLCANFVNPTTAVCKPRLAQFPWLQHHRNRRVKGVREQLAAGRSCFNLAAMPTDQRSPWCTTGGD